MERAGQTKINVEKGESNANMQNMWVGLTQLNATCGKKKKSKKQVATLNVKLEGLHGDEEAKV